MKRRAFTLIELLVVIAIVGLLSTIAIVSLSNARKNARNTKRIADIKQLVSAFNLGLDANGSYPSTGGDHWKCVSSSCSGWGEGSDAVVDAFIQPYMPLKPTDPNDGGSRGLSGYLYNGADVNEAGYPTIYYLLEVPATSCGIGFTIGSTADYFQCKVRLY